MMNLLALFLVVSSLVAAGIWSPSPEKKLVREDVTVKEGPSRVIIVETYDEDGQHNTEISFSPPNKQHGFVDSTKDILKEASYVLPNLGQGISPKGKTSDGGGGRHTAGELVCDAFGKCRHMLADAVGKARDKVSETAEEAKEKIAETEQEDIAMKRHMAHESKETVKEKTQEMKEGTEEVIGKAMETGKEAMGQANETGKKAIGKAKETGKEAIDMAKETGKTIGSHIASNVSEKIEDARQNAAEMVKEAKETTEHATKRAKTGANKILDLGRNKVSLNSLMGIANLLGFATAYGTSMWVTFVSSYVLAELLPRQQFALVQSKTYPVYFRVLASGIGLALLGHVLGQRSRVFSSKAEMFQAYNLLSSLLIVLYNALYLEPRATKAMFERMRLDKEEGRGRESFASEPIRVVEKPPATATTEAPSPAAALRAEQEAVRSRMAALRERLRRLNTNSSFLNVLTLMALTWHLVYLGHRLGAACLNHQCFQCLVLW